MIIFERVNQYDKEGLNKNGIDYFYDATIKYPLSEFRVTLENELKDNISIYGEINKYYSKLSFNDPKIEEIYKNIPITCNYNLNLEIKYYILMESLKTKPTYMHYKKNIFPAIKVITKFLFQFDSTFFSFSIFLETFPEASFVEWLKKSGYKPYIDFKGNKNNVMSTTLFKRMICFFRKKYMNEREILRWNLALLPPKGPNYPLYFQRFIINCHYLKERNPKLCYNALFNKNELTNYLKLPEEKTGDFEFEFQYQNVYIQIELKHLLVKSILSNTWSLKHCGRIAPIFKRVEKFMKEMFPEAVSLLDIPEKDLEMTWKDWLQRENYTPKQYSLIYSDGRAAFISSVMVRSIKSFQNSIRRLYNSDIHNIENIFDRNIWSIEELAESYLLEVNLGSVGSYYFNFEKIQSDGLRSIIKVYLKEKILSQSITLSTAIGYLQKLTFFCNFLYFTFPEWNDFRKIDREVFQQYFSYFYSIKKSKDINRLLNENLQVIRIFLLDLKKFGWNNYASLKDKDIVLTLEDFPRAKTYSPKNDKFIPLEVLQQFFHCLPHLSKDCQIIIWIMYFCGLRISDVLNLKNDCIVKINEKHFLKYDNIKSKLKNNFIPLPDENLVISIKELINFQNESAILRQNDKGFLFWNYSEKAKKFRQINKSKITNDIRKLTYRYNIVDSDGVLYFISTHQFRHTFGNHLIENGVDIMTIRHWMGHKSIYPTFIYTKNSQKNLREQYDLAYQKGIFSIINSTLLTDKPKFHSLIKRDTTITPLRTYYGTCLACDTDSCKLSIAPPCLRINEGAPCKDLGIGFSDFDKNKYDFLIKDYEDNIKYIEENKLEDIRLQELKLGLQKILYIRGLLEKGYCVYGRKDRFLND